MIQSTRILLRNTAFWIACICFVLSHSQVYSGTNHSGYYNTYSISDGVTDVNNQTKRVEEVIIHGISVIGPLYPVPATDNIQLDIVSEMNMEIEISIYDKYGMEVTRKKVSLLIGNNTINVSLPNLTIGLYQLLITFDNRQKYTKSFLVN